MESLKRLKDDLTAIRIKLNLINKYSSELVGILRSVNLKFSKKTKNTLKLLNKELNGEIIVELEEGKYRYYGRRIYKQLKLTFPSIKTIVPIEESKYGNNYGYSHREYTYLNAGNDYITYKFDLELLVRKLLEERREIEPMISVNESIKDKYDLMIVKAAEIKEIFNLVFYSNENIGLNMAKHTLAGEIIELLKEELNIERSSF